MQSLKSRDVLRNPITWGAGAIVFATVVAVVLAWVYAHPPGQNKIVTFYTTDAAQIRSGDEVRMAGITVGKVDDLSLEPDKVRVRARVENNAFVGDRSQVDVRMLTVVGGYYVNIKSVGDTPLGSKPIPLERVTMPYSLIRALTDTTKITENVNPKPVNESLNEIQRGLTGKNVEALSAIVEAGNSVTSTLEKQRGQVTAILDLADEYVGDLNNYREEIVALLRKTSIIVATLRIYNKGFGDALEGLGEIGTALRPIGDFYANHRAEFIEKIRSNLHRARLFVDRNGVTIRLLQRIQNLFERVLDGQNARPALLATDLCVPVPGSPC